MEYFQAQDGKKYCFKKFYGFGMNFETLAVFGCVYEDDEILLGEYESETELLSVGEAQREAEEQGKSVFIFPPKGFSKSR